MISNTPIKMQVVIHDNEVDENTLEQATIRLMNELREIDGTEVERVLELSESLTKGDNFTVGLLLLATLPTTLPAVVNLLQYWTGDRRKISVETANGVKVEFIPSKLYSEKEVLSLIESLSGGDSSQINAG